MRIARIFFVLSAAFMLPTLLACTSGGSSNSDSSIIIGQANVSGVSGSDGQVVIEFEIRPAVSAFQLAAQSPRGLVRLTALSGPGGADITQLSSNPTLTRPAPLSPNVTTFPFVGGIVTSGVYRAQYRLLDEDSAQPLNGVPLTVSVLSKIDPDPSSGVLRVNLILVGAVANDPNIRESLEKSVKIWRTLFGRASVNLDVQWYEIDGPRTLPSPFAGSPYYDGLVPQFRPDSVNIFMGIEVSGLMSPSYRFGLPGSKPGSAVPGPRSAIAISIIQITGGDGAFDLDDEDDGVERHNDETRLAAEELARLTAQYLGLENIVDFSGNEVIKSDSLSDTPSCIALLGCRNEGAVRENVMFPFPIREADTRGGDREYYPRQFFTSQQSAVLNNSVLVD